jgi:TRAP-type C4-dicarboxylate transport system permease small subunit
MRSLTLLAAAANEKIDPSSIGIAHPVKSADSAVSGLLTTAYAAAGIVCVIIIIVAGYTYVTSSGDPSSVKRAKEALLGAIIGIVVILMAFTITKFILGRF